MGRLAVANDIDTTRPRPVARPDLRPASVPTRGYELFDGMLIVRTAPTIVHQRAVGRLALELQRRRPSGLEVIPGPIAFQPSRWRSLTPDIVVLSRSRSPRPPVLIGEVIDHTRRFLDRNVKPDLYAACGVDHYWLFDPMVPEFIAYRRIGDHFSELVTATGDERVGFDQPIPVEIRPSRYVDR
jgi:Uma2 family endonuclease